MYTTYKILSVTQWSLSIPKLQIIEFFYLGRQVVLVAFATIIRVLYTNNSILNAITGFKKHQIFVDDEEKI